MPSSLIQFKLCSDPMVSYRYISEISVLHTTNNQAKGQKWQENKTPSGDRNGKKTTTPHYQPESGDKFSSGQSERKQYDIDNMLLRYIASGLGGKEF